MAHIIYRSYACLIHIFNSYIYNSFFLTRFISH